eukprot:3014922-Pyramimonas_sp.AAC.2
MHHRRSRNLLHEDEHQTQVPHVTSKIPFAWRGSGAAGPWRSGRPRSTPRPVNESRVHQRLRALG